MLDLLQSFIDGLTGHPGRYSALRVVLYVIAGCIVAAWTVSVLIDTFVAITG